MRALLLMFVAFSCVLAACASGSNGAPGTPPSHPETIELEYDGGSLNVELARTPEERERGLGYRDALAHDSGMLFDLGETRVPGFWMKGMRFPLDMVWIDEDKRIVGVTDHVQPEPAVGDAALPRYSPEEPVRYVLELNAGQAARLGLQAGDAVRFELPQD